MYEIEAARIAQTKASNADVKALASMILEDHTAAGEKLQSTASSAAPDVALPTMLDQRRKGMIDNLNAAAPDDFDKVYLDQQVAAHNETLTLLNGFSDNSDAPALATLAREMIPTITTHRDRAQALVNGM
jgi:putative membrane protein